MEEKISSQLKLAELKTESFRRTLDHLHDRASSVLSLTVQWKDIEDHFGSIQNAIQERAKELLLVQEEVKEREKRLSVAQKSVEERFLEIEARENVLELIRKNEFEQRERDFEWIEKSRRQLDAVSESMERKLTLLEEKTKKIELLNDSMDKKRSQIREKEREVSQRLKETEAKEKQCEQFFVELKLKQKQLEEQSKILGLKEESFSRSLLELELKENKLRGERKEVELKADSLDKNTSPLRQKEREVGQASKEIEAKEKQYRQFLDELKFKQKQIEEQSKILNLKEENFSRSLLELEVKENKLEGERKELGLKAEKFKDLELKEKQIQEWGEEVELEKKKLMEQRKEVELKEKQLNEQYREIELKEKQVEEGSKIVALKDENFGRLPSELNVKEKKLEEERKELGLRGEKFKELELKEMQIKEWCEKVELEKKNLGERSKEIELKEKQLNEQYRELELKERHLVKGSQNPCVLNHAKDYATGADVPSIVTMDGKALQIFLNEHCGGCDSTRNDVSIALALSSDPAKLVLDAMEGFYPPHLEKGNKKNEETVVRRSCILLLEQLMKTSTETSPSVKKEAMRLAFDWRTKMKVDAKHSLEVLGFLQLVASYGLASSFDADVLLTQLELVAQSSQAPEIFRGLGFADKISGFVENLIRKKQYIEAIRFIYAFELVNEFPPVHLLNGYLKDSKNAARRLRRKTKSLEGEVEAANQRIADLRCAIRCIEDCKIEYRANLRLVVEFLEKENSVRKANLAILGHGVRRSPHAKKRHLALSVAARGAPVLTPVTASATSPPFTCFPTSAATFVPVTNTQSQQLTGNKRPWTALSAEDNLNTSHGDHQATCTIPSQENFEQSSLGVLSLESKTSLKPQPTPSCFSVDARKADVRQLSNMLETHQLHNGEISAALQSASDPGKIVLDVIIDSFPFKLEGNKDLKPRIPKKSCIFLLELLRRVSPQINAEIREQATKFALIWKRKLAKNPLEVICFLQFLAAYRSTSIFNADELLGLLDTKHWRKEAPDLCQVLGLADKIPGFIEDYIPKAQHLEAVKYIYALDVVDKFPPVPILKDYLSLVNSSKKKSKSIGDEIGNMNKEIKSLKAVIKCIADYKITGLSTEDLKERIVQLEEQRKEKIHIQVSKVKQRSISSSVSKLDPQHQVSPASVPTASGSAHKTQLPKQSGDKRPKTDYSRKPPLRHAAGLSTSQGVPCMNAPAHGDYVLAYPPYTMQLNSYDPRVIPSYHWTAFGNRGPDRPPLPFSDF